MSFKYFTVLLFLFFHTKVGLSEHAVYNNHSSQETNALNIIINYLNTETKRTILFPSYLYAYKKEVERYKNAEKKLQYGPSYFSSHKNYVLPQKEYELAIESTKKLSKKYKIILKKKLEDIHKILIAKEKLTIELHYYAQNKNYLHDGFYEYDIKYKQLCNLINNYRYSTISLYAEINRIHKNLNSEIEIQNQAKLAKFQKKIKQKITLNQKLTKNISWLKNDSLIFYYIQNFGSLDIKDSLVFFNSYMPVLNSKDLIEKYKDLFYADKNWEHFFLKIIKNKIPVENCMDTQTRLLLLYNEIINQYNSLIYEMETNFPLAFDVPLLLELKLPLEYFEKMHTPIIESTPSNQIILLIDASISMNSKNKLDLFKNQLISIFPYLRNKDEIAMVLFSGKPKVILPLSSCIKRKEIINALNSIRTTGSTNIETGLEIAFNTIDEKKTEGNKRIILITDGIFNINEKILKNVKNHAQKDIKLSVFYFGSSEKMQNKNLLKLVRVGEGNFHQIDEKNIKLSFLEELSGQ